MSGDDSAKGLFPNTRKEEPAEKPRPDADLPEEHRRLREMLRGMMGDRFTEADMRSEDE